MKFLFQSELVAQGKVQEKQQNRSDDILENACVDNIINIRGRVFQLVEQSLKFAQKSRE